MNDKKRTLTFIARFTTVWNDTRIDFKLHQNTSTILRSNTFALTCLWIPPVRFAAFDSIKDLNKLGNYHQFTIKKIQNGVSNICKGFSGLFIYMIPSLHR